MTIQEDLRERLTKVEEQLKYNNEKFDEMKSDLKVIKTDVCEITKHVLTTKGIDQGAAKTNKFWLATCTVVASILAWGIDHIISKF